VLKFGTKRICALVRIITAGDGRKVYASGDTVPFSGTDEIAARYAPVDLAILHLGRVQLAATGDATFSLSAGEAVRYALSLGARLRRVGGRGSHALAPQR
jgi:L-ascorbate metabolism protein UlaG (beta-lactamase superfamily)